MVTFKKHMIVLAGIYAYSTARLYYYIHDCKIYAKGVYLFFMTFIRY